MSEANTKSVTILTPGIVAEIVARHLRNATVRKVKFNAGADVARVFLNFAGETDRRTPKTAGVLLDCHADGYTVVYGNTCQQCRFDRPGWAEWFAAQGEPAPLSATSELHRALTK